jgi:hypothetical protein
MARATYIYVVAMRWESNGGSMHAAGPVKTFTVKRELLTWLGKQTAPWRFSFWRLSDGEWGPPPRNLTLAELRSGKQIR